jgi:CRISPR-associated protein Cmr2
MKGNNQMVNWKQKLLAFLHDPPHKPVRIVDHEQQRASFLTSFGIAPEDIREFERVADWQAAAADRLIFPDPGKSGLRVDWAESWLEFRHPLGGGVLTPRSFPPTAAKLEEELARALDAVKSADAEDWQRKFVAGWRLWPEFAARERNPHLAYLVADTRMPDHTLWHHNSLAAAFATTGGRPAFLLFQIGPVQDFIAQARKTQDLWSGSYLLSFLIAQGMLAVADEAGPDSIVLPQLRGLPLADFHWWKKGFLGDQRLRASHPNELLTPNLPNRFLALVPATRAGDLASSAEAAVRKTWSGIAAGVKSFLDGQLNGTCPGWDKHWQAQVDRFPVVIWVVHEWKDSARVLEEAAEGLPPLHGGWQSHPLRHAARWAEEFIPSREREAYGPGSNSAFAWALHAAATDWKLAARKNARSFPPWQPPGRLEADGVPKDHLDGRNEVLGGADHEVFWTTLRQKCPHQFKGSQLYGALSVIKRLWPDVYLKEALDLDRGRPVFDPVDEIAQLDAEIDNGSSDVQTYYAVLAMDGDDMGQWVSGTKAALLVNSLAEPAQAYFRKHWPEKAENLPPAEKVLRPLSPGCHAALSEALANFSLYCARPIVEAFGGQLIYAGGDDVLAMTPAPKALDCAQALQLAFRGINPAHEDAHASEAAKRVLEDLFDYSRHADGFVTLRKSERGDVGRAEHLKPNWPLVVMGPEASASVGIAIGHVHSPMQDTIQAARDAERDAKSVPGKGAFCLRILKRSGESVALAARWQSGVPAVWAELGARVHDLSSRFAYRYAQLVRALVIEGGSAGGARYSPQWTDTLAEAVEAELRHALRNQGQKSLKEASDLARLWHSRLIGDDVSRPVLGPRDFLQFWTAWAFVSRISKHDTQSES